MLIAPLTGAPFLDNVERALVKLERALPVASRRFLAQLPVLVKAKVTGRKKQDDPDSLPAEPFANSVGVRTGAPERSRSNSMPPKPIP